MLAIYREGRVDVVLCYDPDRLSRDLSHLLLLANEFEGAGVRLEFITQETDTSPEGRMFFAIRGAVAEYEKAKIRERTARGRCEKARQGKVVNPRSLPKWLRYDRTTAKVYLDEEWAEVARLAFRLVADEALTVDALRRRLNTLGITTPNGGTHWQVSTLRNWLRNPAAKGEYYQLRYEQVEPEQRRKPVGHRRKSTRRERPREDWNMVPVPPIVSPELWEAVQRRLESNKALASRNARREYLLAGLVRCGECGGHMCGWYRDHRHYRCSHYRQHQADIHGNWCAFRPVRADGLEEAVWDAVTRLLQHPERLREELRRRREEGSPTREVAEQELRAARKRLEAIPGEQDCLVEGYGKRLIPDDLMRNRMEALKAEREEVQARVVDLERRLGQLEVTEEQETQALAFAERVKDGLKNLVFAQRQQMLRLLVEDVTCYEGKAIIRTIIPPPAEEKVHLYTTPGAGIQRGQEKNEGSGAFPQRGLSAVLSVWRD
jgi:site-specific DNA recombinase